MIYFVWNETVSECRAWVLVSFSPLKSKLLSMEFLYRLLVVIIQHYLYFNLLQYISSNQVHVLAHHLEPAKLSLDAVQILFDLYNMLDISKSSLAVTVSGSKLWLKKLKILSSLFAKTPFGVSPDFPSICQYHYYCFEYRRKERR